MTITISSQVKDPERIRQRRSEIVHAAVGLFAEKGFHRTTTRAIAKASGLSTGALYEYVASKEDVLFLVCQHIHQTILQQLKASLAVEGPAAERLRQSIQAFIGVMDGMQDEVLLIYQESKSLSPPFLHEVLRQEFEITRVFENLLQEGIHDGSLRTSIKNVPLLAHDIVVAGQMWAFRRWALSSMSFTDFAARQTERLMQACDV
ncbi:TetR/AcrR family transcriptional regulator [Alicyclobacillaceae bacterium I2511]|nr:TetR/AcrR family transcriptional regulator [Alicyclobacillaceae bacterium I2511]